MRPARGSVCLFCIWFVFVARWSSACVSRGPVDMQPPICGHEQLWLAIRSIRARCLCVTAHLPAPFLHACAAVASAAAKKNGDNGTCVCFVRCPAVIFFGSVRPQWLQLSFPSALRLLLTGSLRSVRQHVTRISSCTQILSCPCGACWPHPPRPSFKLTVTCQQGLGCTSVYRQGAVPACRIESIRTLML